MPYVRRKLNSEEDLPVVETPAAPTADTLPVDDLVVKEEDQAIVEPVVDTTVEPATGDDKDYHTPGDKYKHLIEEDDEVKGEIQVVKVVPMFTTLPGAYSRYETEKQWNDDTDSIASKLEEIRLVISELSGIVDTYKNDPESITTDAVDNMKRKVSALNNLVNANLTITTESTFFDYVTMMNSIVNTTIDRLSDTKNELATMLGKFKEELESLDSGKHKDICNKVVLDIKKRKTFLVTIADYLIKQGSELPLEKETFVKLITDNQEVIKGIINSGNKVNDTMGNINWFNPSEIDDIALHLMGIFNIVETNPALKDILSNDSQKLFTFLTALPIFNNVYLKCLELINAGDDRLDNLEDKIKNIKEDINQVLVAFVKATGVTEEGDTIRTNTYHKEGFYGVTAQGQLVKVGFLEVNKPKVNFDILNNVNNVLQSFNVDPKLLTDLIDKFMNTLRSTDYEVTEDNYCNVVAILGSILGMSNIYRDEAVYGIFKIQEGLARLICAYFNLINTVSKSLFTKKK